MSRSRRAWPAWAAQPVAHRVEVARRFANEVRADAEKLAELIAKEAGKPLWEAKTEVEAVIAKIDISVQAYAERTGKQVGSNDFALYGQEMNGSTWALCKMNMFLHEMDAAHIQWEDTIRHPQFVEDDALMKFDIVIANPPFSQNYNSIPNFRDRYKFWMPKKKKAD